MEAANVISLNLAEHRLVALANQPLAIFSFFVVDTRLLKEDCSSKTSTRSVLLFLSCPKVQQTLNVDWICPTPSLGIRKECVYFPLREQEIHALLQRDYQRRAASLRRPDNRAFLRSMRCQRGLAGWAVRSVKQLRSQQRAAARTRIK